jgi:cell division protein FtsZ
VLLSISGGSDLGLFEINEAAQLVSEAAHQDANIIFGAVIDDALGDEVRVTVIAAGFDGGQPAKRRDGTRREDAPAAGNTTVHNAMLGALPKPKDEDDDPLAATIPGSRTEEPAADELDIPDFLKEGN